MSIKEALERAKIGGERTSGSRQDPWAYWDKRRGIESSYEEKVLEAGRSIHRQAGTPELLNELAEIISSDFPDVKINEQRHAKGAISLGIEWNFRDRPKDASGVASAITYEYDAVSIEAYPLTEEVVVWNNEDGEVLTKNQWISDRKLIEDAIVRAYQNPVKMAGPPVRM